MFAPELRFDSRLPICNRLVIGAAVVCCSHLAQDSLTLTSGSGSHPLNAASRWFASIFAAHLKLIAVTIVRSQRSIALLHWHHWSLSSCCVSWAIINNILSVWNRLWIDFKCVNWAVSTTEILKLILYLHPRLLLVIGARRLANYFAPDLPIKCGYVGVWIIFVARDDLPILSIHLFRLNVNHLFKKSDLKYF